MIDNCGVETKDVILKAVLAGSEESVEGDQLPSTSIYFTNVLAQDGVSGWSLKHRLSRIRG